MPNVAYFLLSLELKCPDLGCVNPKSGSKALDGTTVKRTTETLIRVQSKMQYSHLFVFVTCNTIKMANFHEKMRKGMIHVIYLTVKNC